MANYLGDYREDETLHFLWSSNDGSGASITRATDGTVSVYKDNGVAQSVAGITDTEDFDSLTGIHACTIDLSADAFYATGANYDIVLSAATIDGQTVNAVLAQFSIENRWHPGTSPTLYLGDVKQSTAVEVVVGPFMSISTHDPLTSMTETDITCGLVKKGSPPTNTALSLTATGVGNNDIVHLANGFWRLELTATDTNTLGYAELVFRDDDVFRPLTATFRVLPANAYDSIVAGSDALDVSLIQVLGTAVTESTATAGVLDVNVAEISDDSGAADALEAAIDQANNNVGADVQQISGDTTAANNLESYCDGSDRMPVDVLEIGGSGATTGATRLRYMMDGSPSYTVDNTSFAPTTTAFETSATEATADHYKDKRLVFQSGALIGQEKAVTAYSLVGGRGKFTVDALTEAPANGDRFILE